MEAGELSHGLRRPNPTMSAALCEKEEKCSKKSSDVASNHDSIFYSCDLLPRFVVTGVLVLVNSRKRIRLVGPSVHICHH